MAHFKLENPKIESMKIIVFHNHNFTNWHLTFFFTSLPRIIPGPTFSVNIAGKYKKNDYEASTFYRQNLQNIYENAFNAAGTLVGGAPTIPGLGGLGTTNDDLTSKRIKNAKFIGNYLGTVIDL